MKDTEWTARACRADEIAFCWKKIAHGFACKNVKKDFTAGAECLE